MASTSQKRAQTLVKRLLNQMPDGFELPAGFETWASQELPLLSEDRLVLVEIHVEALEEILEALPKLEAQLKKRKEAERKAEDAFPLASGEGREMARAQWEASVAHRRMAAGKLKREQINAHKHLGIMMLVNRFVRSHTPLIQTLDE